MNAPVKSNSIDPLLHPADVARVPPQKPVAPAIVLLTPKEVARLFKVSVSWLAKARMRGDGPPYYRFGRSIRPEVGTPIGTDYRTPINKA